MNKFSTATLLLSGCLLSTPTLAGHNIANLYLNTAALSVNFSQGMGSFDRSSLSLYENALLCDSGGCGWTNALSGSRGGISAQLSASPTTSLGGSVDALWGQNAWVYASIIGDILLDPGVTVTVTVPYSFLITPTPENKPAYSTASAYLNLGTNGSDAMEYVDWATHLWAYIDPANFPAQELSVSVTNNSGTTESLHLDVKGTAYVTAQDSGFAVAEPATAALLLAAIGCVVSAGGRRKAAP